MAFIESSPKRSLGSLLLLLHLLNLEQGRRRRWRLLCFFHHHRPIFRSWHVAIKGRRCVKRFDFNGNVPLACRAASKDAVGWRNVRIIPTDGSTNVALPGQQIICRIETDPA